MAFTAESGASNKLTFSIRDIIRITYLEGFTKIIYWEESLENLKSTIVEILISTISIILCIKIIIIL